MNQQAVDWVTIAEYENKPGSRSPVATVRV